MTSPGTLLKSRELRVSTVKPWLIAIDAIRKSIVAIRRRFATNPSKTTEALTVEGKHMRSCKCGKDTVEHAIAALDIGGRFGTGEIGIATEGLFVKADDAERQI